MSWLSRRWEGLMDRLGAARERLEPVTRAVGDYQPKNTSALQAAEEAATTPAEAITNHWQETVGRKAPSVIECEPKNVVQELVATGKDMASRSWIQETMKETATMVAESTLKHL